VALLELSVRAAITGAVRSTMTPWAIRYPSTVTALACTQAERQAALICVALKIDKVIYLIVFL